MKKINPNRKNLPIARKDPSILICQEKIPFIGSPEIYREKSCRLIQMQKIYPSTPGQQKISRLLRIANKNNKRAGDSLYPSPLELSLSKHTKSIAGSITLQIQYYTYLIPYPNKYPSKYIYLYNYKNTCYILYTGYILKYTKSMAGSINNNFHFYLIITSCYVITKNIAGSITYNFYYYRGIKCQIVLH